MKNLARHIELLLRDNEVGVLHLLLSFLDRGLVLGFGVFDLLLSLLGFGVFDLLLSLLDINLGLQMSSSTLLFSL